MKKCNLKEVDNFHIDNNRRKMVSFIKTAFNESLVYLGFILIHGIFATISNSDELGRGKCHLEELRVEISMECDVKTLRINIVSRLLQNVLASCQNINGVLQCHDINDEVQSVYNRSSGLLIFITQFNHTEHAGYKLWVNSTCKNNTDVTEYVLLKPCVSGFTTSAYHNSSHVTISCEHESFKMSDGGIRVVGMEDLAHCWWNKATLTNTCFGEAEALTNGFRLTTLYTTKMNISCKFDGQSIDIEAQEKTTTTMQVSSTTTTKTSRSSMTTAITTPSEQTKTTTMHVTKPTVKRTTTSKRPSSHESQQKTTPTISRQTKQISTMSLIVYIFIFFCIHWIVFI